MSFTPTNQLYSDPNIFLRNQQHASRLFVDDQFRLLPKNKFLFHVAFNINPKAVYNTELLARHKNEINMLVKSIDLPKFTVHNVTLHQYNRKKVVQYQHKFEPLTVKFNDDNMGVMNLLWQNYYRYYYYDQGAAEKGTAFKRNAIQSSSAIRSNYGYTAPLEPFFNYITIYQMARHDFVSYRLINPVFSEWNHNSLDYAVSDPCEFDAKIAYESVYYDRGTVSSDTVDGFGLEHYDLTPSPLSGTPNTTATPIITGTDSTNPSAATQVNNYQNMATKSNLSTLTSNTQQTTSGLNGITFPGSTTNTSTVASLVNLGV